MSLNGTQQSRDIYERKLRLRELHEELLAIAEETSNKQRIQRTEQVVHEVDLLLTESSVSDRVKHPGEAYLDSRVLRAASESAVRCSEAISGNINTYDRHELAKHIRENPEHWEFPLPLEVPALWYLHGTFAPTPPEQRPRPPRRRVERQQLAQLQAPKSVDKLDKTEEGSQMVIKVKHFLKEAYRRGGERPLSYFHVVLDPDSFSSTVENIYHVSFLARDGNVAIRLDAETGLPFITPVSSKTKQPRDDISDENQFIVSIDMDRWQELIEAFDIRKPMMVLKRT